jgi:hypothetical protein
LQALSPKFKPQFHQRKKKTEERVYLCRQAEIGDGRDIRLYQLFILAALGFKLSP